MNNMAYVLSVIDSLRKGWYLPPSNYYGRKKTDFEYQSYKRSAMTEIKFYLMEHRNKDPISVIEDFRIEMGNFVLMTKNINAKFMFSIYYEVATDVLDILLGMR